MLEKKRAIILKTTRHSESDLIVHALSDEGEFLSLMAKGAIKSKKRFGGGVLEPTHCVRLSYKSGKEDSLGFLNEAKLEKDFSGLRKDLDRLNMALYFLKVVRKLMQNGDHGQRSLFNILGHSLAQLELCTKPQNLKLQFEVKVLHQQGVLPPLADYQEFTRRRITEVDDIKLDSGLLKRLRSSVEIALSGYLN